MMFLGWLRVGGDNTHAWQEQAYLSLVPIPTDPFPRVYFRVEIFIFYVTCKGITLNMVFHQASYNALHCLTKYLK